MERIQLVRLLLPDHPITRPSPAVIAPRRGETLPAYDPSQLPVYKAEEGAAAERSAELSPHPLSAVSEEPQPVRGDAPPYAPLEASNGQARDVDSHHDTERRRSPE